MTIQQMIETAIETGAAVVPLWTMNRVECYTVRFLDTGEWIFTDETEHAITEDDARRLLDCFQIGYIND